MSFWIKKSEEASVDSVAQTLPSTNPVQNRVIADKSNLNRLEARASNGVTSVETTTANVSLNRPENKQESMALDGKNEARLENRSENRLSPPSANAREEEFDQYLNDRFGKTRSALGPGTVIQGKLSFDTNVRIDGKLSGDVYSSKSIIVGKTGVIEAEIEVAVLVVLGLVKGNIRATERVEIIAGGCVEGSVHTPVLVVDSGSSLNGACKMGAPKPKSIEAPTSDLKNRIEEVTISSEPPIIDAKQAEIHVQ